MSEPTSEKKYSEVEVREAVIRASRWDISGGTFAVMDVPILLFAIRVREAENARLLRELEIERLPRPCHSGNCEHLSQSQERERGLREALEKILVGCRNQTAHSGMAWFQAEEIIVKAIAAHESEGK